MKSRIDKTEYNFIIDERNNKYWYKNGLRHREKDKPARIYSAGRMFWYIDGELIRISKK